MPVFTYQAIEADQTPASGTVIADSAWQARDQLRDRGLTVQSVEQQQAASQAQRNGLKGIWLFWLAKRHRPSVTQFARELSTLLGVGVPLLEAMDTLIQQQQQSSQRSRLQTSLPTTSAQPSSSSRFHRHNHFLQVLLLLREQIASGESLSQAMATQPHIFDAMCINLAEVGEDSGTLERSLEQLAVFREKSERFRGKLLSALMYPMVVVLTGLGVTLFLMTVVVPDLIQTLLEAGRPLPWVTQWVKWISDAILHFWWLILLIAVGSYFTIYIIGKTESGRRSLHLLILRLPLIGELARKQALVRIAHVISTLIGSGVVFLRAMEVAERSTSNKIIQNALLQSRTAIGAGREISEAFMSSRVFPPLVIQVFAIGQRTGKLESMLERLAVDYDRQLETATERVISILEPVLILILAVIVGFVAFATVLPILEAGNVF